MERQKIYISSVPVCPSMSKKNEERSNSAGIFFYVFDLNKTIKTDEEQKIVERIRRIQTDGLWNGL